MLRQTDPLLRTVCEGLVLPDGHLGLEVVDQLTGGGEGLLTMSSGSGHDHRQVSDLQVPGAVMSGQLHAGVRRPNLPNHPLELGHCSGVGGVLERVDRLLSPFRPVVGADCADEHHETTGPRMGDRGDDSVHREWAVGDRHRGLSGLHRSNLPGAAWCYAGSDLGTSAPALAVTVTW